MEENYKLAKWINDEMTEEELIEFQSESDYHLYQKIKLYSSELETPNFNEQELFSKIIASKNKTPKVIALQPNWFLRIAAVLVVSLGLLFTYYTFSTSTQLAENGKQTTFSLPDNSEVVLNSGSEIEYKKWNWSNNRNLNLTGEAYFRVAKGKKFQVITNLGKVSVLGTQFNVKARKNRFDVTCFEGRVKVDYKNQEVIITKGQTVAFENDVKIIEGNTTETKPTWTAQEMAFEKENLANVIEEIQRQYNLTITSDEINSEQLFTGKIPSNNIVVTLQISAASYHLRIIKRNETSYTLQEMK
jgi:transmembrane sensor